MKLLPICFGNTRARSPLSLTPSPMRNTALRCAALELEARLSCHMPHAASRMRAVAVPGCQLVGGAESAILRTWPDNDDNGSGLNDVDDDDSEGNVHWHKGRRGSR